jgi:Pyruvate/2-oxoacid:ferredoxin oxidoreductase delta subunit
VRSRRARGRADRDLRGLEHLDNGRGLIDADPFYGVTGRPGYFVAGDIIRPHLLTTAVGHASIAAESIHAYLGDGSPHRRPKVDVHHFSLLDKLREAGQPPAECERGEVWATDDARFAVHNFEDRSRNEVIPSTALFLGHFDSVARRQRATSDVSGNDVVGHFEERFRGLGAEDVRAEAERCMSCGLCFECDNCVIYCPQDAVLRVEKSERTTARYVYTDYSRCTGCHICADVCPSGYIDMGMGE